jgi:hypothetical protein
MKRLYALIAAAVITGLVGLGMLAVGVNAALNPNTVAASNAPGDTPGDPATTVSAESPDAQAQIKQLQNLIAQYQDREKQYQARLSDAATQLDQASQTLQSYQQVMTQLQQLGMIRVGSDGSITIRRRGN